MEKFVQMLSIRFYLKDTIKNEEINKEFRVVYINNIKPESYDDEKPGDYANNKIITSKVWKN